MRSDENDDLWGDIFNLQHTVRMPIPTSNDEAARNMAIQEAAEAMGCLGGFLDITRLYDHHRSGVLVVRYLEYIIAALLQRPLTLPVEDERDEALERDPWGQPVKWEEELPEFTVQPGHAVMLDIIKYKCDYFILDFWYQDYEVDSVAHPKVESANFELLATESQHDAV